MEYLIVGLLVLIVILLIVVLTRKQNNNELNEKLSRTEINVIKEISDFKHDFSSYLKIGAFWYIERYFSKYGLADM